MQRLARLIPWLVLAFAVVAFLAACGGKGGGY